MVLQLKRDWCSGVSGTLATPSPLGGQHLISRIGLTGNNLLRHHSS